MSEASDRNNTYSLSTEADQQRHRAHCRATEARTELIESVRSSYCTMRPLLRLITVDRVGNEPKECVKGESTSSFGVILIVGAEKRGRVCSVSS